jgi:sugar diacid utilization regulator
MAVDELVGSPEGVTGGRRPAGFPEVVEAFNEISGAITEHVALDSLLHIVAMRICELLDVRRCSVYLRDERTGLFRGQVGHADRNIDAAIKGLTAGIEADGFTREILTTKRPVLIVNAQSDPRPVRSTMLEWNVQTMLGVPMVRKGQVVGLLFLDNEDQPHDYSESEQSLCGTFANLAAIAISHAQLTSELRTSLQTVERQNKLLRTAAAIEERLATLVLKGANLHEITEAVAELTGKPTMVIDAGMRPLATAPNDDDGGAVLDRVLARMRHEPELAAMITKIEGRNAAVIDAAGRTKLAKRMMAAPIMVGNDAWGYLVVIEQGGWFNAHDRIVTRRAGTIVALEMSAERRAADAEMRAQETLARDLIVGTDDPASLLRRANFHGLHLTAPHAVMLFATGENRAPLPSGRVFKALQEHHPEANPLVVGVEDGVAAVIELASHDGEKGIDEAKSIAADALTALGAKEVASVAISGICDEATQYPSSFREAQQVSRCISVFCPPDAYRVLASADIGAARLLLSGTSKEDAERFARDTLGELLDPGMEDLLATVQMFFAASRSVRRSAELLSVHENTIRYRLGRIREVTHLDVAADADDQLTLQLGLLILRLVGRISDGDLVGAAQATAPEESSESIRSSG